eukprot:5394681-Alexandrium_andersonii.AAC.1
MLRAVLEELVHLVSSRSKEPRDGQGHCLRACARMRAGLSACCRSTPLCKTARAPFAPNVKHALRRGRGRAQGQECAGTRSSTRAHWQP